MNTRPIDNSNPILHDATTMQGRGFVLFPCLPGGKEPACRWRDDVIRPVHLWAPGSNYGIDCAKSRIVVIDIDVKHSDGFAEFDCILDDYEQDRYPHTFTVETASGGMHLYFRDASGKSYPRKLSPNIDIQGAGRYVLGPGSIVGGIPYGIVVDTPAAQLPAWLREALSAARPGEGYSGMGAAANGPQGSSQRVSDVASLPARQLAAMLNGAADAAARAVPGTRNDVLHWAACRFGEAVAARRVDQADAIAELATAAERSGLLADDGPACVTATIRSGLRKAGAQ